MQEIDDQSVYFDPDKIDEAFVMESYREGQRECIQFAVDKFNSGKRFVILECPTGSGKSAIGMTLAGMVKDSYYLTITKILQDQLTRDFDDIVLLKGRSSYPCTFYERHGDKLLERKLIKPHELLEKKQNTPDCNEGYCKKRSDSDAISNSKKGISSQCFLKERPYSAKQIPAGDLSRLPKGMRYSACPYYEQVYQAINSQKVSMNFSSFIYQTSLTTRFDSPRDLIIIDEAHNIEQCVLDFVTIAVNDEMLQEHDYYIPNLQTAADYLKWFKEIQIESIVEELRDKSLAGEDFDEADKMDKLLLKINTFYQHVENERSEWVVEYTEHEKGRSGKSIRSVVLKPVFAHGLVDDLIFKFGHKIIMLSATILDVNILCNSLGIDRKEVAAYRMKNRFPVENRPIYIKPAARMTGGKDKMAEWMPKLVKSVEEICNQYQGVRGIIHTHNFAILEGILEGVKPSVSKRLISQKECPDKQDLLKFHADKQDSIIVAPAMHEGVDLKDDLSRFQIICKVPYANFYENKQLARRVELDSSYYDWITALKLIQSYGRSIRSPVDYADTFIIDEAIFGFLRKANKIIPVSFTEAIVKS
jgi:Rad3-related DNA helicase